MNTKEFKQPSLEQVQEAFRNAGSNPEIQTLLRTLYGDAVEVDNRPITERIKSFEDALNELEARAVKGDALAKSLYDDWHNVTTDSDDLIAFLKLRIVCAALNEGWEPKHTEDEVRYYPWHWLYTQDELKDMREEEKINRCMPLRASIRLNMRASALRSRVALPRVRMRLSALAFAYAPRNSQCIVASNSSNFGLISS